MFGAIWKARNSSFQKGMTFCRSIYVKKVMRLLAFIFEQPSYTTVEHIKKIEYTAQNDTNFYTFISASGTPSSRKK